MSENSPTLAQKFPNFRGFFLLLTLTVATTSSGCFGAADAIDANTDSILLETPTVIHPPTVLSSTAILVQWVDNESRETGYEIEVKNAAGQVLNIIPIATRDATSYTHTGLNPNTFYGYRVRAYRINSHGHTRNSEWSLSASATTEPVVVVDTTPPILNIATPSQGDAVNVASVMVQGTASDASGIDHVMVNGNAANGTTNWSKTVPLNPGPNVITVVAADLNHNETIQTRTVMYNPPDTIAPALTISGPTAGQIFTTSSITVSGSASDASGVSSVTVNGATATGTNSWSKAITLTPGSNTITVIAKDPSNNATTQTRTVTYNPPDTIAPALTISAPTAGQIFTTSSITVSGSASDASGVSSVTVNGATASGTTSWNKAITLTSGSNTITVVAKDAFNNATTQTRTVTYNPPDSTIPTVTISSPANNATVTTTSITVSGTAADASGIQHVKVNSLTATGTTTWSRAITLTAGSNTITAISTDLAGNPSAPRTITVTYNAPDSTAPTPPTGLMATVISCSEIRLTWTASTDSGSGVKEYRITRNGSPRVTVAAPATSHNDTGLSASTAYNYMVSAMDNAGNPSASSSFPAVSTPACPDNTAPTVPTGLITNVASCNQIDVGWNASTDSGSSGLKGYNLYRGGVFLKPVLAPATSTTDSGLTASTTYAYSAAAIDNAGNESARSAATSTSSATTPTCPVTTTNPTLVGTVAAVGSAKDVVVQGGYAYVASAEFGLSIVDVSNPNAPVAKGVSNPPFYAERVAVGGKPAAPLALLSGNGLGLKVVDIKDPNLPRVVSSMPGTMTGVAMAGEFGYVIEVVPGNPARTELVVLDLRAPATPVEAGRLIITTATELTVSGSFAYLASRITGMQIVDISNPAAPAILRTIDTPGIAKDVAVSGGYAYVADDTKLQIIDVEPYQSAAIVGELTMPADWITVEGTRLYVLDGQQLRIVDVTSPTAPVLRSTTNGVGAQGIDAVGTFAYLASPDIDPIVNKGGLYVIDAATPTAPRIVTNIFGGFDNWGVGVSDTLKVGVVAGNGLGLKVVDLSNPNIPKAIGSLAGTFKDAVMMGQYAYTILIVPGNPARIELAVIDLRTPSAPTIAGRVTLPGGSDVQVDGSFAYVTAGSAGLQIVNISSPSAPSIVGSYDTPGVAQSVAVANNLAYVADDTTVQIINVASKTNPFLVKAFTTQATTLAMAGPRVYAVGGLQLKIIDVATPTAPVIRSTTTAYGSQAVQVIGDTVFLATPGINHFDTAGGIYVLDVVNSSTPRLVKQIITPGTTRSLAAVNGVVYAGDSAGIIDVIDLTP